MQESKQAHKKRFGQPDERRPFKAHGQLDIVSLDPEHQVGLGRFEPGWRWSQDVKPIAGTRSCEAEHFGYCLRGSMTVKMDDGQQIRITAGDAFHLPPGHDAWVDSSEPCELLDFAGYKEYALQKPKGKAA